MKYFLMISSLILTLSCQNKSGSEYVTVDVKTGDISNQITVGGRAEPATQESIMAPNDLSVLSLLTSVGSYVEQGSLLAKLDTTEILKEIEAEESRIFQLQGQLKNFNIKFQGQKRDLETVKKLYLSGAVSLDDKQKMEQEITMASNELKILENNLAQASKSLASLKEKASFLDIKAPLSGTITHAWVTPDEFTPGQSVKKGDLLFKIASQGKMLIRATLRERDVIHFSLGQKLNLTFPFLGSQSIQGIVKHLDNAVTVDKTSGVGSFKMVVEFEPTQDMKAGMEARITLTLQDKKNVLIIPKSSLNPIGGMRGEVQVVENGLKIKTPIELGAWDDVHVEVLKGLSIGQKVLAIYEE